MATSQNPKMAPQNNASSKPRRRFPALFSLILANFTNVQTSPHVLEKSFVLI